MARVAERRAAQAQNIPTVLLTTEMITELTNAASTLFHLLFQVERALKAVERERLHHALADVDVFRNGTEHEEPEAWQ